MELVEYIAKGGEMQKHGVETRRESALRLIRETVLALSDYQKIPSILIWILIERNEKA